MHAFARLSLVLPLIAACGGAQSAPCDEGDTVDAAAARELVIDEVAIELRPHSPADANVNAVLWVQTAVEYATATIQTYRLASLQLETGLADLTWTASPEQQGAYDALPPAVVMDLDETVLDNSPYQAWLVTSDQTFDTATWDRWCDAGEALAVPGALDFVRFAVEHDVTVFFVSNRAGTAEEATRANLEALGFGFALREDIDNVLLKYEREEWGSDKGTRRIVIGETHRIVLSIGDNLGDFIDGYKVGLEERADLAETYAANWGTRWIVLPNPTYGSWEQTLYGFDYALSPEAQLDAKRDRLRAWDGE